MLPPNSGWLPAWAAPPKPRKVYDIPPVVTRHPRGWWLVVCLQHRSRPGA